MKIANDSIIGALTAFDYNFAATFQKYGIDFCFNGNRSIEDACKDKNIDPATLINELEAITASNCDKGVDYNSWTLDALADYIEKKHHRYVEEKSRAIMPALNKIIQEYGDKRPELYETLKLFSESVGELAVHMKKEELMLFPQIRKMVKAKNDSSIFASMFGSVRNPILAMTSDHDSEGARFQRISEITSGYAPPDGASTDYKTTLSMLKEFEEDLRIHIHLENNILFPKSIKLEEYLNSSHS